MHELAHSMGLLDKLPTKHNALHDVVTTYEIYKELLIRMAVPNAKEAAPVQDALDTVGSQVP